MHYFVKYQKDGVLKGEIFDWDDPVIGWSEYIEHTNSIVLLEITPLFNNPSQPIGDSASDYWGLKRIREDVEKDIVSYFKLKNNFIDEALVLVSRNIFAHKLLLKLSIKINGKEVIGEGSMDSDRIGFGEATSDKLVSKAEEILVSLISNYVVKNISITEFTNRDY